MDSMENLAAAETAVNKSAQNAGRKRLKGFVLLLY
jgi:hypothetical protein